MDNLKALLSWHIDENCTVDSVTINGHSRYYADYLFQAFENPISNADYGLLLDEADHSQTTI